MAETPCKLDDLDKSDCLRSQRWEWTFARIGWLAMGMVLVAAVLGLLGPGLFSARSATAPDGSLTVKYHMTERYEAPARLRLYPRSEAASRGIAHIAFSNAFTRNTRVEAIDPVPESVELRDNRTLYTFRVQDVGPDDCITYRYQNNQFGPISFEVGLEDQQPVTVRQFVVP